MELTGQGDELLATLPLHIIGDILARLDNFQNLQSAIRSGSTLLAAFREHRRFVLARITYTRIPSELIAYVVLLEEARQVKGMNKALADKFLAKYSSTPITPDYAWAGLQGLGVPGIMYLNKNYDAVEALALEYARETLPRFRAAMQVDHGDPSDVEMYRVKRALLRYQILNNVCLPQGTHSPSRESLSALFYGTHPPWVNKQIACVFEFLESRLNRAVQTLIRHDIYWGFQMLSWGAGAMNRPWILTQFFHRGLPFLQKVICGPQTYDHWVKILQPDTGPDWQKTPRSLLRTSFDSLDLPADAQEKFRSKKLGFLLGDSLRALGRHRDAAGNDGESSDSCWAWFTAHRRNTVEDAIDYPLDDEVRGLGYVIWDFGLDPGTLGCKIRDAMLTAPLPEAPTAGRFDRSFYLRRDLWLQRGRGWWGKGSEFKDVNGLGKKDIWYLGAKWRKEEKEVKKEKKLKRRRYY